MIKGYTGLKRSAPSVIKETLRKEMTNMKGVRDQEGYKKVQEALQERKRELQEKVKRKLVSLDNLVESVELSKPLKYYTSWSQGSQVGSLLLQEGAKRDV